MSTTNTADYLLLILILSLLVIVHYLCFVSNGKYFMTGYIISLYFEEETNMMIDLDIIALLFIP